MTKPFHHPPGSGLAIVASCTSSVEAALIRSRLEAAGIPACIPEEYTPQILWCMSASPLERVTVRVDPKDLPAATELLAEDDQP
ncbi:MAG: DUF2007 domain-containing protein [Verrucomicrobiales bacterium]|nr:DUF2007 domain-containing protein [Verrucomicrobiales bacterium]